MDELKAKLAVQEVELQKKNDEADKLIRIVEAETAKVNRSFFILSIRMDKYIFKIYIFIVEKITYKHFFLSLSKLSFRPQVSKENEIANEEKRKVAIIEAEVAKRRKECEEDLVKAEPALVAAKEALNTLNKVKGLRDCRQGSVYM